MFTSRLLSPYPVTIARGKLPMFFQLVLFAVLVAAVSVVMLMAGSAEAGADVDNTPIVEEGDWIECFIDTGLGGAYCTTETGEFVQDDIVCVGDNACTIDGVHVWLVPFAPTTRQQLTDYFVHGLMPESGGSSDFEPFVDIVEGDTLICTPVLKGAGGIQCETASGFVTTDVWCFDDSSCYAGPNGVDVVLAPADGYTYDELMYAVGVPVLVDPVDVFDEPLHATCQIVWDIMYGEFVECFGPDGIMLDVECNSALGNCWSWVTGEDVVVDNLEEELLCALDPYCNWQEPVFEPATVAPAVYVDVSFDGFGNIFVTIFNEYGNVLVDIFIPFWGGGYGFGK